MIPEETEHTTQPVYRIQVPEDCPEVRYVELREDIAQGQRVESFRIEAQSEDGSRFPLFQGTTTLATGRSAS